MKKAIVILIIAAGILARVATHTPAAEYRQELRIINTHGQIAVAATAAGYGYTIDADGLRKGDIIAATMDDNGTPEKIADDTVKSYERR